MKSLSRRLLALLVVVSLLVSSLGAMIVAAEAPALTDLTTQTDAADAAVDWLLTQIQPDGSFPVAYGHAGGVTCDAALAGVAALKDVSTWSDGVAGASPVDYLEANAASYISSGLAASGKLAVTIVALDLDPWQFAGQNLWQDVYVSLDTAAHQSSPQTADLAWNILAMAAMRQSVGFDGPDALMRNQNPDGGWGWMEGEASDADSTALAIMALLAADWPASGETIALGVDYLGVNQTGTGGWGWGSDSPSSTAYALEALLACGEDPADWTASDILGATPLDALLALQMGSGGFPGWTGAEDVMSTAQAIPGLVGRPLPIPGVVPALADAIDWLMLQQEANGSYGTNTSGVILAAAAAGEDPRAWTSAEGISLIDALEADDIALDTVGRQGRAATAMAMAGENPNLCGEINLVGAIADSYDVSTGSYDAEGNIGNHVLAMWGMLTSDVLGADAAQWLADQQNPDGGWGWAVSMDSDSNSTAIAIEALIASGYTELDQAILDATVYLKSAQSSDGGFVYSPAWGNASDTDSTAVALQALYACGVAPQYGWDYAVTGDSGAVSIMIKDPETRLLELQNSTGAFEWMAGMGDNEFSTIEAIPALARVAFPAIDDVLANTQADVDWLRSQQQGDGSWSMGLGSPAGATLDVILAGAAAGRTAGYWKGAIDGATASEYLAFEAATYATSAANAGKLAVGVVAMGDDPFAFGGLDLQETILGFHDGAGSFGNNTADSCWAILGLDAIGGPVPAIAVDVLKAEQASDGGWGWQFGQDSDADTTAYVLQSLMAAGVSSSDPVVVDGLAYLGTLQVVGGGFEPGLGWGASPNSTAVAIQAIVACGQSPKSAPWGSVDGDNPVDALYAMRLLGGAYPGWMGTPDVLATAQAVTGVMVEPLPLVRHEYDMFIPSVFTAPAN